MKNRFILTALVALLFSCSTDPNDATTDPNANATIASFVKTYEGLIDNQYRIVLKITSDEGDITGTYFYTSQGGNLKLQGELSAKNEIVMNEFNDDGNQVGLFKGTLSGGKIEGTWSKPDGSKEMSFSLIESSTVYESLQDQTITTNTEKRLIKSGTYAYSNENSVGTLRIEKINDLKCRFSLSVGSEFCTGEIDGTLEINKSGKATFATDGCESLYFSFTKEGIGVREGSCFDYHGARCTFDGFYK